MSDFLKELGNTDTKNFKKVTDDMKTKNQNVSKVVKEGDVKKTTKKSRITGEKQFELEREQKWIVMNIDGDKGINVDITDLKHTVYVHKVDNSNVIIKGKCTTISVDDCVNTVVIFENVVASAEIVNCKRVKFQVTGSIPTMLVDKTDGINIYLSEKSLHTTIVTSKSSEMNVSIPEGDEGDYKEFPIPEQFTSVYDEKSGKLVTQTSSHHF
jgi:adenylyl cyclase-associated protein